MTDPTRSLGRAVMVVPTYNEATNLEWIVGRLRAAQPLQQTHQEEQLGAQLLEVAAGLVLVLQRPAEPEERDRRGVGVDLDGTPVTSRAWVQVEPQGRAEGGAPGRVELGLAGVGRVRSRVEAGEVPVQRGLGGPVAGRVVHHQRGVEGDQAGPFDVRRKGAADLLVGAHRRDVDEPAGLVEDGEARGLPQAPGEVDTDVEHGASLPYAVPDRPRSHASGEQRVNTVERRMNSPHQRLSRATKGLTVKTCLLPSSSWCW